MPTTITLTLESESIQYLCKKDKRLAKVISTIGPISYLPYEDGYAFLVHEIIEQMLSVKAGAKIYARLENLCVGEITPDVINGLSDEEIRSIGTSAAKVSYIRSLTQAIASGALDLALLPELDDKSVIKQLTAIKGIGNWTAKMYLILCWTDKIFSLQRMLLFFKHTNGYTRQQTVLQHQLQINAQNGNHTLPLLHDTFIVPWILG